ncbi:MAG: 2OG-Fe(II) oxygenase, partial [Sedimenticola sp.]
MLKKVITALEQLETQGSFAARETTGSEDLQIEINPIGRLRFPLKPAVAKKLIQVARPAPFGWRDKTCLDTEVRNTWKIPKSRVKIDKRLWNKTLIPTLNKLKDKLGLPEQERLKPELHDVLIYGPGQFFAPHQDSEKCNGMIATLVVVLPSTHSGGGLIIEHQGGEKRFQSSRTALDKLTFFAFYADCQHAVRPITAGYRVALIYNMVLQEDKKGLASALPPQAQQGVTSTLEAYFATPPTRESEYSRHFSNKIVYLLDHQYTPKGVSWKALKGADRLRATALLEAATALDLEIHLTLADVRELWECEEEEPYWGYGARRRRWSYDDDEEDDEEDDEASDVELLDLIEESLIIKYWRDQRGKSIALPEWHPSSAEICWTRENSELDPFQSDHEGWMGNYGNTMERWYHRAAIILWSREERYSALLEIDPETMIRELLGLADKKSTHPQSQEIVRQLLPNWSGLRGVGAEIKPSSFNRLFRLAHRLDSPELARGLLLPLSPDALSPKTARAMIRLQSVYGTEWLIDIIQSWLDTPAYPQWGHLIDGIA